MKRIFICYSHKDEKWKDELLTHLRVLERQDLLEVWDDRRIEAGVDWYNEIEKAINEADAAVLLISAEFLTSDFILNDEIPKLLQRRAKEEMKIFPLIVEACAWKEIGWLGKMQVRPKDGKPLAGFNKHKRNSILSDFSVKIKNILNQKAQPVKAVVDVKIEKGPEKITLSKLPTTRRLLLGREKELEMLDKAWEDTNTYILTLVAWGGVGKTALVNEWLNHMAKDNYRSAERVYGWSFCSQGTSEDRQTSADDFINDALIWFGDSDPTKWSPWDKGKRLAGLVRQKKTLLILDGMEPLQYPPGEMHGRLKDQALQALLKELARSQAGLCVVTTRVKVEDIEHAVDRTVNRICLDHLSPEVGAELLKTLGLKGTEAELKETSEEFKGHALALNLLGRYLAVVHDGDILKRDLIPRLTEEEEEGGHARRVMESYEKFLSGKPELNILYLLGLFDRPADGGAIEVLRTEPVIKGITDELRNLSEAKWKFALKHLRDLSLLAEKEAYQPDTLDCHPLVREHFGEKLRQDNHKAWKEAHSRLYEYYKNLPEKYLPDTLKEMEPLYTAVNHGCKAKLYKKVWRHVYWKRINREREFYSTNKLGAYGTDLAALSGFFETPWNHLVPNLAGISKASILNMVGFRLLTLGRLREAAHPMQSALDISISQKEWKNAARTFSNLSRLYLIMGEINHAVEFARKGVTFVNYGKDISLKYSRLAILADALHHLGELSEANNLFKEAETAKKKHKYRSFSYLFSLSGFFYCDLLVGQRQYQEVKKRANLTIKIAKRNNWILIIALDQLSLGRAHWLQALDEGSSDFTVALDYMNQAIEGLREAGTQDYLPLGLLARAAVLQTMKEFSKAWEDLEEAYEIAKRGSMNLYIADYHLEAARLCLAEGKKKEAAEHLATAREMINKMGYHRRDKDVKEIEEQLEKKK